MSYRHSMHGLGFDLNVGADSAEGKTFEFTIAAVCGLPLGSSANSGDVVRHIEAAIAPTFGDHPSLAAGWIAGGAIRVRYHVPAGTYATDATRRRQALRIALSSAAAQLGAEVGFRLSDGTTVGRSRPCAGATLPSGVDAPGSQESTQISVRSLQQLLLQKGFNVGPSGADGRWGTNTSGALTRALGTTVSSTVSGGNVMIPSASLAQLQALPNRPVGTAPAAAPQPGAEPIVIEQAPGPGSDEEVALSILPWAIGAAALLGVGGYFLWKSRRRSAANRRRR